MNFSDIEKEILNIIQFEFPITIEPYKTIADKTGLQEIAVIEILNNLFNNKIIRQISPIYDSKMLGYKNTLVAFKVSENQIEKAADIVNSHPGVSHNYLRDNEYNMWFTITLPPEENLEETIDKLFKSSGVEKKLILPSVKIYKIGVKFNFVKNNNNYDSLVINENDKIILNDFEKKVIALTQDNLELISRPFRKYADKLGISEEVLIETLNTFKTKKIMRRFAAILYHKNAGFKYNVMAVWKISDDKIDKVCKEFIKCKNISHCYVRKTYPEWKWNVYTMIHTKTQEDTDKIIKELSSISPESEYMLLKTIRELKKVRVKYFTKYIK